jgi:hypothetical protein
MKKHIAFLHIIFLFLSCNKGSQEVEPTGPVTASELQSIPLPTFQQFINAYEFVTNNNPSLLKDKIVLARAVFNRIKSHPNGRLGAEQQLTKNTELFDLLSRLTYEELKVIFLDFNLISGYEASKTVGPSAQTARLNYPCDSEVGFEDSKADAFRHAYWNALMVRRTNAEFAEAISTAHESKSTNQRAVEMDLQNNKVGRTIALTYPTATDEQIAILILQQKFTFLSQGDPLPKEGLVYFSGKRTYDATFTGSFTNPDSGGPWTADFNMNQCGETIRGQFTIILKTQ